MRQPAPPLAPPPALSLALAARGGLRVSAGQCLSAPCALTSTPKVDIAAEDWDMLFRAALDMLARVTAPNDPGGDLATDHPNWVHPRHPLHLLHPLQTREVAIRDCLDALDHLRRSVPLRCTVVSAAQASSSSI